ncbi:hypothetical protein [Fredinandcohnia quinoae]|uniref:Uncharacterized protein n=1 Tax=Fredinandcohnia quinoae TaxID=2918902 RepID=A0AAW5E8U6_9BACI|nr:hypothetical protein [Fredinandcohnia sp. SECRCQ15]MCH1626451.1 hypothetical protein [Fredinandcohnia sp. SECRCQ15]
MDWKKYAFLLIPFLLLGIILVVYLPHEQIHYATLVPLVFWAIYYIWIYIEKRQRKE